MKLRSVLSFSGCDLKERVKESDVCGNHRNERSLQETTECTEYRAKFLYGGHSFPRVCVSACNLSSQHSGFFFNWTSKTSCLTVTICSLVDPNKAQYTKHRKWAFPCKSFSQIVFKLDVRGLYHKLSRAVVRRLTL